MKNNKSEFRYRGKDLGIEKLKILELAHDDIEDHDIEYMVVDNSGRVVDMTDWIGDALSWVSGDVDERILPNINKPWHIHIVNPSTLKDIPKSRFRKLFGDALLLEHRVK